LGEPAAPNTGTMVKTSLGELTYPGGWGYLNQNWIEF
jgi:hypothetical protein